MLNPWQLAGEIWDQSIEEVHLDCADGVSIGLRGRVGQFTRDVLWEEPEEEMECGVIRELGASLEGSEGSMCELVLQT